MFDFCLHLTRIPDSIVLWDNSPIKRTVRFFCGRYMGIGEYNQVIERQLTQFLRDIHKDLFSELISSELEFSKKGEGKDRQSQITHLYYIWRDCCISGAEKSALNYLQHCNEIGLSQSKEIQCLDDVLSNFTKDTFKTLELNYKTDSIIESDKYAGYIADGKGIRLHLEKRITEIIENAKDGYCEGKLIYRFKKPDSLIVVFFKNQWEKIVLGILTVAGGGIIAWATPVVKKYLETG